MATANPGRIVGGRVGQLGPGVPVSSVITFRWSGSALVFS
jgi:hypothetical protein